MLSLSNDVVSSTEFIQNGMRWEDDHELWVWWFGSRW